jgi:monomeric isocitrate dehydrogenase
MATRQDLTGGWVELRSAADLTERQARRLRAAMRRAYEASAQLLSDGYVEDDPSTWGVVPSDEDGATPFEVYNDALIEALVVSWSWDGEIKDAANVLPQGTYAELYKVCSEINNDVANDLGADGAADPKAATDASLDSEPPSAVESQTT